MTTPTTRFSNRVADYVATRPGYPPGVLDILRDAGLTPSMTVADIGSGTGLSTQLFLANGNTVFGVEPNRDMREAGEQLLAHYPNFHSVIGTAEATTLPAASVDVVVAGQAFHWFDVPKARIEFHRIVRPDGFVVLMWNTRRLNASPFLTAYEGLLQRFGTDYRDVVHTNMDRATLIAFFGSDNFRSFTLDNFQTFDREGLRGRLRSSSYTPDEGHADYEPMMRELDRIFDAHSQQGAVRFEYDTAVYIGQMSSAEL
jgi:SAM-dependent methyltransferase